jgi:hypothetical protein
MRYIHLSLLIAATVLFSCKKEKEMPVSVGTPLPVAAVLLKDVVLSNLPSPYYHFEYDTKGKVTFVSFASDFTRYDVMYGKARSAR